MVNWTKVITSTEKFYFQSSLTHVRRLEPHFKLEHRPARRDVVWSGKAENALEQFPEP